MTDFDPAANAAFPLEEASNWIERWRAIDGGFWCRRVEDGIEVQLARNAHDNGSCPDIYADDAARLQAELLSQPRMKQAVMTLALDAWTKGNAAAALAAEAIERAQDARKRGKDDGRTCEDL